MRAGLLIGVLALAASFLWAQDSTSKRAEPDPSAKESPQQSPQDSPRENSQESSSRDTRIDTSPPKDDAKAHPNSAAAVADLTPKADSSPDTSGVQEFHPWNPMKANKDIQVGDFYYKRKNYKAALDRYKEALYYKDRDAVATFRIAECQEKLGDRAEAKKYYEQYLKILPEGPLAKEAHASLAKMEKNQ